MYTPIIYETRNALQLGDAGEHIVCADLLLAGWNAYQVAQGLPYDVVVDVNGRLLRVAVKSSAVPRRRPLRPSTRTNDARAVYKFTIRRASRLGTGKTVTKGYTAADVDIVALVALDIRQVAYISLTDCKSIMELFAPHAEAGTNRMGPKSGGKKRFELLTFDLARETFT